MRWGTVVDAITTHASESAVDPQELLLAQLVTVRLVLIQASGNKMDEDDWQNLFGWLSLRLPVDIAKPQFEDYRPALKGWLHDAVAQVLPEQTVDCLLSHLVTYIAELLQLDELEQQLLMLAWLRRRHEAMNPIMLNIEAARATRVLSPRLIHEGAD